MAIGTKSTQLQLHVGDPVQYEMDEDYNVRSLQHCKWEALFKMLEKAYVGIKVKSEGSTIIIKSDNIGRYEMGLVIDEFLRSLPSIPIKSMKFIK